MFNAITGNYSLWEIQLLSDTSFTHANSQRTIRERVQRTGQ
jgi:hypothetical protein